MAKLSDLKPAHEQFIREYTYRQLDWRPGAVLRKPLWEATVAIVTTAAFHSPDQPPFDTGAREGDCSYRILDSSIDLASLRIAHRSSAFDSSGIEDDKNLALPLDRLTELAGARVIGAVAPWYFSFMGSITNPDRLIAESAPEVAGHLVGDSVDAVLLTPV